MRKKDMWFETQPLYQQYNWSHTSLLIVTALFDEPSQVRQKTSHWPYFKVPDFIL
jgi:hypothetical protein